MTFQKQLQELYYQLEGETFTSILCCGRGGLVPSAYIAHELGIKTVYHLPLASSKLPEALGDSKEKVLIVEDISDSGESLLMMTEHIKAGFKVAVLCERYSTKFKCDFVGEYLDHDEWIDFDWEIKNGNN